MKMSHCGSLCSEGETEKKNIVMDQITRLQFPTNSMKTTRVLFPGVMQTS